TDEYTDFPIDLFYMDLNGTWTDSNNNRIYDNHTGHVAPEIWVGRLYASSLSGNEITLLQNYFDKNHKYRTGVLSSLDRALVYIDDDWVPWADSWSDAVGLVYNDRTLVKDKSTTIATDYKNRLTQNQEHVLLAAHSSPSLHQFNNSDNTYSYVYSSDIKSIDPHALFYNLFACSNARYIENDYMAGWYIFANTYGLAAVGSTKTGSMLEFQYFYEPLSQGKNLGEAFKEWFTIQGITYQSWHYGMVLLGDPTLTPKIKDVSISSSDITYHPFVGKPITINATIHNSGDVQLSNISVQFYNGDPALGGFQISSDKIIDIINASENKTISMVWNTSAGSYNIYVVVDPYNSIIEIDETNNKAYQTITIQEPTNTILLVDDDYFYRSYSYESYYKNALDVGNYSYNIWHVNALGSSPNATILSSYQVVIWFTGNDWSATLTTTDQTNLQRFLDSGGNLFISGQDIGWDLTSNGTVANTFYSNYLHARYIRDDTNIYDLYGTGDPVGYGLIIN
ncbi:MAG: CARDB domain-containing protein, partial [Candidatus Subteraquimicrobiales bacterium]|nr:CARDB domain-containing protein [Candidatus Subteraquimicrobiales bacterium]